MRNFRATINGITYDVAIEEITNATDNMAPSILSTPAPVAAAVASAPVTAPAPTTAPVQKPVTVSSAPGNGLKVSAPMPGTVLDIKVNIGDKVQKNQPLLVLEAMKMENDIVSPVVGTVDSIHVVQGASVNSGELLVSISES